LICIGNRDFKCLRPSPQGNSQMESCGRDVERLLPHVPLLKAEAQRLKVELIRLQQWAQAHPDSPHPAAPQGPMSWDNLLLRFGHLERELRMLNEKISDPSSAQLRHFVVIPRLPDEYDHKLAMQAVATGRQLDPGHLPPVLSTKLHIDMLELDRKLRFHAETQKSADGTPEASALMEPVAVAVGDDETSGWDVQGHNQVADELLGVLELEMARGFPFGGGGQGQQKSAF